MAKHAKNTDDLIEDIKAQSSNEATDEPIEIIPESSSRGNHARVSDDEENAETEVGAEVEAETTPVDSAHKNLFEFAEHHKKKSKRTRTMLTVAIIVLLLAFAGLGYFAYTQFLDASKGAADEGNRVSAQNNIAFEADETSDATSGSQLNLDVVPALSALIGMNQDEALEAIGHGASVTSTSDITKEEKKDGEKKAKEVVVGSKVTVSLSEIKPDPQGGVPSVHLILDKKGIVTKADFSSSLYALNCNTLSFTSAVNEVNLVGNILTATGLDMGDEVFTLPKDEDEYRTYDEEGTKPVEEKYTFEGKNDDLTWSLRLTYDYTTYNANSQKNLSDTIQLIYVCIEK